MYGDLLHQLGRDFEFDGFRVDFPYIGSLVVAVMIEVSENHDYSLEVAGNDVREFLQKCAGTHEVFCFPVAYCAIIRCSMGYVYVWMPCFLDVLFSGLTLAFNKLKFITSDGGYCTPLLLN